jgi:hypothetical protein
MRVYNCKDRSAAANIGYENVRKLDFNDILDAAGITDEKLAQVGSEGLNATRPITDADGKIKAVPDYVARHRYWETNLKLKSKMTDKLELTGKDGEPLQMQVLAGVAYVPSGTDPRSNRDAPVADTSVVSGSPEIQDADLAPQGEENNNRNS